MKRVNKKGQGLPLTTIIIAILVVVVLIVLVAFFLGGSSAITDTIKRVFYGTTAGYDLNLAIQTCQTRCDQLKDLPVDLRKNHAFCQSSLGVDKMPVDGEADFVRVSGKKKSVKYYCPHADKYEGGAPSSYRGAESDPPFGFLEVDCEFDQLCARPADFSAQVQAAR